MIKPESKTIENILKGTRYKLSVPNYQRSFDWGKAELSELIDDLKSLIGKKDKELFLGNLIFNTSNSDNYSIVDGQQRLTTISLILIAARQHAKMLNEFRLQNEIQDLIGLHSAVRNKSEIKFTVSNNIRGIFEYMSNLEWDGSFPDKVEGKSLKKQNNKIKPIYSFIKDSISGYNFEQLKEFMIGLYDTYVIVLEVKDHQDIFAIYERTNARGLDLNIGDLLKNYIFSKEDEIEDKWNEIVENANGGLPRMLKYFWSSRKGYIQQSNLYRSLKSYVKELEENNGEAGMKIFISDLYSFSRYYKAALSPDNKLIKEWLEEFGLEEISKNEDYYQRISRVFQALKLFRVTQAYPLLFSILKFFRTAGTTSTKWLFTALENIEKYHFVNNVISGKVGHEVEKFYAETATRLYKSKNEFFPEIEIFLKGLKEKKALKEEFTSNFIDTISYNKVNIALINYVFDRINNFDGKNGPVKGAQYIPIYSPELDLKKRNYNIEHFLAQSNKNKYSDLQQEQFDKIGNLLIIARHTNSELQDKLPKEKIKIIMSDRKHFGNLRYLDNFFEEYNQEFETWNFESIERRSIQIAEDAFEKVWNF